MPQTRFSFSADRKRFIAGLLGRIKPRLDLGSITRFLLDCEKDIAWCLSGYPDGWDPNNVDAELLIRVSRSAYELNAALRQLHSSTKFALAARLLAEPDRGIDVQTAKEYAADVHDFLERLRDQAMDLKDGAGTPINVRVSEELAACFAVNYVYSFKALPSLRHDGIYKQFLDEITNNDLPERFRMRIGKNQMAAANRRASVHLDTMLLNKSVTEPGPIKGENQHG